MHVAPEPRVSRRVPRASDDLCPWCASRRSGPEEGCCSRGREATGPRGSCAEVDRNAPLMCCGIGFHGLVPEAFVEPGGGECIGAESEPGITSCCPLLEASNECTPNSAAARVGANVQMSQSADPRVRHIGIRRDTADREELIALERRQKELAWRVDLRAFLNE